MRRLAIGAAIALSGCVVYQDVHSFDEPPQRAVTHLYAGQVVTLLLADGSAMEVTYRGSAPEALVVTHRETFANKELRLPFSQVKSVHFVERHDAQALPLIPAGPFPMR